MKMKWSGFLFLLLSLRIGYAQREPLKPFSLSAVTLTESPFYKAQQTDLDYILSLDPDRLLAPFMIDAGFMPKAERYGNWENTGLDGHIGGHYLSALSLMYAATITGEQLYNKELLGRLDYMVETLAACQEKNGNGYVGGIPGGQPMWKEIAEGKIKAGSFSLNDKWVPLYNIHKLFAGLRDAYEIAGNKKAKEVLVKLTDWFAGVTANLSDEQIQEMLRSEHGGMNEVLADVAAITGDKEYLVLAQRFSHKPILSPLLRQRDALTGLHANTQIPKVIGFKRIADMTGDTSWAKGAEFFWETVVKNRSVSIGGNSVREHFHPANNFSSMIESNQGPETCNTYNMLRLTKMLFLSHPDSRYMDYFERALYNHILSSQHPEGGFVYFTPMRPRHYRVYSQPQESFWCCVGSGLENHGKYGELIYAHSENDIYVNLFIASTLNWQEKGIRLEQDTKFPFEETSSIKVSVKKHSRFRLYVRHPGWVRKGELVVKVNGKAQPVAASSSSYVSIDRVWKTGDVVTITMPMHTSVEYLPDHSSWASILHGPIVLAAATDSTDLKGLRADDSRMGHVAEGKFYPVEEAPMFVKQGELEAEIKPVAGQPLTFTTGTLIYPEQNRDLKLVPFFTLHDTRYMIYWQVTTPADLEKVKETLREKEQKILALEAVTVDQVVAGEQQPEVEHGFKGDGTETGTTDGRSWRMATGWFSYELKNTNKEGKVFRITYPEKERNRKFNIYLNDRLFQTVDLPASQEGPPEVDYEIPAAFLNTTSGDRLTIKFEAHPGNSTGRIFQVRLLRSK